jgi:glutathione S-transferase
VWTLPCLRDPSPPTSPSAPILVTESRKISEYLENAYPNTKPVFPQVDTRKHELHEKLILEFSQMVIPALAQVLIPAAYQILGADCVPRLQFRYGPVFFKSQPLHKVFRKPEERVEIWARMKSGLDKVSQLMDEIAVEFGAMPEGEWGPYTFGQEPSFADIVMMANFLWSASIPTDRDEGITSVWEVVKHWNEGRWERMVQAFDRDHGIQRPRPLTKQTVNSLPSRRYEVEPEEARL